MNTEITIEELKDKIVQQFDELQLLEALDLTVTELVDILEERIEDRYDTLLEQVE